jgi:hypothetical protein
VLIWLCVGNEKIDEKLLFIKSKPDWLLLINKQWKILSKYFYSLICFYRTYSYFKELFISIIIWFVSIPVNNNYGNKHLMLILYILSFFSCQLLLYNKKTFFLYTKKNEEKRIIKLCYYERRTKKKDLFFLSCQTKDLQTRKKKNLLLKVTYRIRRRKNWTIQPLWNLRDYRRRR